MQQLLIQSGVLVSCFCIVTFSFAQSFFAHPDEGIAYPSEALPSIFIECGEALEWMLDEPNWYSNIQHPASFSFVSGNDNESLENVGIRLRGNTSRAANKKSFKISFNAFDADGEWQGVKKLNLNGEHNDPSTLRARLVWESFRDAGIPVSRSTHVQLHINGTFYGIYSTTEHIDGSWLDKRFQFGHGNLWKCTYPADLSYLGPDPEDYKFTPEWSDQRVYELKTNEDQDDYSALSRFIVALNDASNNDLACALQDVFDVDAYLKVLAGEILVGHWDNYVGNKNNYYLYQRSFDDRIMYLPYDVDNSFGIQWFGEWTNQDPYNWTESSNRPLYDRIMANQDYRDRFSWYLTWWMENWQTTEWVQARGEWIQSLLSEGIELDAFYGLDYGFDTSTFESSITEAWGNHVAHSIAGFVESRNFWADVQLEPYENTPYTTPFAWAKGPALNDTLEVMVWAHEVQTPSDWTMTAHVQFPDGSSSSSVLSISDTELHGTMWRVNIPLEGYVSALWHVTSVNPSGGEMQSPCTPKKVWNSLASNGIVINEVMPKNDAVIADLEGDFQDWVEVYNSGISATSLNTLYLTNRWAEPNRWKLPNVTLDPGQHMLIWCDDESDEGPLHASFTLDASDDELFLMQEDEDAWRLLDSISWTGATANESHGRVSDGDVEWIWFEHLSSNPPTPNGANGTATSIALETVSDAAIEWRSFQIPSALVSGQTVILPFRCRWEIIGSDGKYASEGRGTTVVLDRLKSGLFVLIYHDKENKLEGTRPFVYTNQ